MPSDNQQQQPQPVVQVAALLHTLRELVVDQTKLSANSSVARVSFSAAQRERERERALASYERLPRRKQERMTERTRQKTERQTSSPRLNAVTGRRTSIRSVRSVGHSPDLSLDGPSLSDIHQDSSIDQPQSSYPGASRGAPLSASSQQALSRSDSVERYSELPSSAGLKNTTATTTKNLNSPATYPASLRLCLVRPQVPVLIPWRLGSLNRSRS
ncbi:hypothetical protein GGR56DRAFT_242288 [Xylariaceae sp. FL0804]|nr:hypothetical protein GGR56DRAFT_242288 [Xylariaceae sp. FL0804]